jgi:16S rRNA processing protein RimM
VDNFFLIAEIKAVHGSNGLVLIDSYSDFSERFFKLNSVFIDLFGSKKEFFVENVIEVSGRIALKFKNFNSGEDVKILVGKKIFVEEKNSVKLSKDTYFVHDLIGSEVFRNSKLLGVVEDVLAYPANDVYLIKDINQKNLLVPAIKDFIKSFDPLKKRLELVDDCDLLYDDEN